MECVSILKLRSEELKVEYERLNKSLDILNMRINENREESRIIFNEYYPWQILSHLMIFLKKRVLRIPLVLRKTGTKLLGKQLMVSN